MSEHLSGGELEQYTRGLASATAILRWDDHLAGCEECRLRLPRNSALSQWAVGLTGAEEETALILAHDAPDLSRPKRRPMKGWWPLMAAAAALVLAAPWIWRSQSAATPDLPSTWSRIDRALVENALQAGKLPTGQPPADVSSHPGTLLGAATSAGFAVIGPMGVLIEADRPTFRWQDTTGATAYRVEVYDREFHLIVRSPSLTTTVWQSSPLERGKLYQWQVTAVVNGSEITSPTPPAPEALFRVLDRQTEQHLQRARMDRPMGRLLAAALLSGLGMQAEATGELALLPAEVRHNFSH